MSSCLSRYRIPIACFWLLLLTACQGEVNRENQAGVTRITQSRLNSLANSLQVRYQFLSNIETDCPDLDNKKVYFCYSAKILLSDINDFVGSGEGHSWKLNFSQVYPIYASLSDDFQVKHINGDIHQLSPKRSFKGFQSGVTNEVKIWIKSTLISESELMPNYWLSSPELEPAVVKSTRVQINKETFLEEQPYVVPFSDTVKQIKSAPDDKNQYASSFWLYQQQSALESLEQADDQTLYAILPTPKSLEISDRYKRLDISNGIKVSLKGIQLADVSAALDRLAFLGVDFESKGQGSIIPLTIELNANKGEEWVSGHYRLSVNETSIMVETQDKQGAFYGLQSLASLLSLDSNLLPLIEVDDQPKYSYRGQHVDVARNFKSKAFILSLLEQMAAYKLNKLHLHLADDEGWRLEIPSLPELTQVASQRCMDLNSNHCLQPQLGGADANSRDGFYSVSDYQEILAFAAQRYIQVIPSFDMPGHSRAAIKAMEFRYHKFIKLGDKVAANQYLLTDFSDTTKYSSIQFYNDNTLNVCMQSTYAFVDRVMEDLITMHQQVNEPLELYHIGADETAGAWLDSPACKAHIDLQASHGKIRLAAHFIEKISIAIAAKGVAVGAWNDGLKDTQTEIMPKNTYSYIWGTLPSGAHQQVSEQARRGWNIVLSIPDMLYFDFPYQVDPKEPGYNWASRRVTTRSVFNFMPDNLPVHAEFRVDTLAKDFVIDDRLQKDLAGKVIHQPLPKNFELTGIQGQLWGETVRSESQAQYMLFPRMLALAERAWYQPDWQVPYDFSGRKFDKQSNAFTAKLRRERDRQWVHFSRLVGRKELPKLERANIFYRLPTVGAIVENGLLKANIALPGVPMEYRQNGGAWMAYKENMKVEQPIELRARAANKSRVGRSVWSYKPE